MSDVKDKPKAKKAKPSKAAPLDLTAWRKQIATEHGEKIIALGRKMRALGGNPG